MFEVSDGQLRFNQHHGARAERGASIDELLDRAVRAINSGDWAAASALAGQVLAVDRDNTEAEDVLAASVGDHGEIRRLTILFADLVESTALSMRREPEPYRLLVGRYRELVRLVVDRYGATSPPSRVMGCLRCSGIPLPMRTTRAGQCRRVWRLPATCSR